MKFTNFGKKLFAFIAVLTFGLVLVGCTGPEQPNPEDELKAQHQANVQAVLDSIFFDETLLSEVKGNMTLVQTNGKYPDVLIEWASSEADLIAADGSVVRPALDDPRAVDGKVEVTLTVTASQGEAKGSKTFKAYVLGEKKTNVNTIKNIKDSFYGIMKENGVVFNGNTKDYTINATITGEVLIVLGTKGFFISDGTGLMYVYSANPTCKVGDVVTVTAGIYAYYGACQFGSNVSYEAAAAQDFADLTFEKTTIDAYTEELDSARDNAGLIVDLNKMAKYSGYGVELYAKVGKGGDGVAVTKDTYYLEDPYTGEQVAVYYYTTADYEANFDALVGKYVNIKVFTYDCYSSNSMYRVLYSGLAITEAQAPAGLTDAQKVASALNACSVDASLTADATLPVVEGVVWTLKEASANAVIENGVLKVTRPEHGAGNATVVVVATATFGAESDSKEFTVTIVEKEDEAIKEVTEFDALKTYKLGLYQANLGKQLWLAAGIDQDRFALSTENPLEGLDVKVVESADGYQLVVNGKYLEFGNNAAGKVAVLFLDAATSYWTYDAAHNTFLFTYSETTYFLGTYNSFATFSASAVKYIDSGNFICHLYEVSENYQPETPEQPEQPNPIEPAEGTKYTAMYTGKGTTTNMTEGNNAAILGLDATLFNVLGESDGNNFPGLNKNGDIRLYKLKETGKSSITVEMKAGTIKQINIAAQENGNMLVVYVNGVKVEGANGVYNINAASFQIVNEGTATAKIDYIEIIA